MQNTKLNTTEAIKKELDLLDRQQINVKGTFLKPSQCYHVETDPLHVLFNTNCPCELRTNVISIIKKYYPHYEDRAPQNG
jgi:hypothetical protein